MLLKALVGEGVDGGRKFASVVEDDEFARSFSEHYMMRDHTSLKQHNEMENLRGLHHALNNAAADSFEKYSKTDFDILQVRFSLLFVCVLTLHCMFLQENFRPVSQHLGRHHRALFECHTYMKKRYMQRNSEFVSLVSPRPGQQLTDEQQANPVLHVDVKKMVMLLLTYPNICRCIKHRQQELVDNVSELHPTLTSSSWLPQRPPADVVEARLVMDSAVIYSRRYV